MGNKILKTSRKRSKTSFETPLPSTITTQIAIPKKNKTDYLQANDAAATLNMLVKPSTYMKLPIQLTNAQRTFINQTGQFPDKIGMLDYSDMVVQKRPFWGNRWKRGFFTLCKTTLYTMSMKGKILRCYILNGSYCKEGAPKLSSVGIPVGRPTILLFEGLKKLSLNSDDVLTAVKKKNGENYDVQGKNDHHHTKLVPFLRLKAMNRQEHESWVMILKEIVNRSIKNKHDAPKSLYNNINNNDSIDNNRDTADNYVRITSPVRPNHERGTNTNRDEMNKTSGEVKQEDKKEMPSKSNHSSDVAGDKDKNNKIVLGTMNYTNTKNIDDGYIEDQRRSLSPIPSPMQRQLSYEIIDEKDIEKRRVGLINDVAKQLHVTHSHALSLLRQFKWDTARLLSDSPISNALEDNEVITVVKNVDRLVDTEKGNMLTTMKEEEDEVNVGSIVMDVIDSMINTILDSTSAGNTTDNSSTNTVKLADIDIAHVVDAEAKFAEINASTLSPTNTSMVCSICFEESNDVASLKCGHSFCNDCWIDFLTNAIKSGTRELWTKGSQCPHHTCTEPIPESFYKKMLSTDASLIALYNKYKQYATNNFVDSNLMVRWCPGANCNRALYCKTSTYLVRDVTCTCGMSFCFSCGQSPHSPASCDCALRWKELEHKKNMEATSERERNIKTAFKNINKTNGGEEEDVLWLAKNTRPCPQCKVPIQKYHGCNHMTCHNQRCQHEFCWVCLQDWSTHGSATGGYYRCFVNDPVKTKNKLRQLRYEQHDAKNSGAREKLYKGCGVLRHKAQTASYMMLDFIRTTNAHLELDIKVNGPHAKEKISNFLESYRDILIDACGSLSRLYAFLTWGYILNYDQLSKLTEEIEEQNKSKKNIMKSKDADSKAYNSVASEVFQMKLRLLEKSVGDVWNMVEPLHRIYASTVGPNNKLSQKKKQQTQHGGSRNGALSPPPPQALIRKRILDIQNEMGVSHEYMISCREFATIWQRSDEENDNILREQGKRIYKKKEKMDINTKKESRKQSLHDDDEEKLPEEDDSFAAGNSTFYNSLLHPKHQYFAQSGDKRWSCLLCSKQNTKNDRCCKVCLSKHEHPLLEQEIIMFKLKHGKSKTAQTSQETTCGGGKMSKLKSVGSRWRQFQQAELHSRSRRSLSRRSYNQFVPIRPSNTPQARVTTPPVMTPEEEAQLLQLHEMGFVDPRTALGALRATNNDVNRAVELLLVS